MNQTISLYGKISNNSSAIRTFIGQIELLINLVGLEFRELPNGFTDRLDAASIKFEREPKNTHDKYAVKCISNGLHFAYVEREKARFIGYLLLRNIPIALKIQSQTSKYVRLTISFPKQPSTQEFKLPNDGDCAGIYKIKFNSDSKDWVYIGQSTNINKRLKSHLSELNTLSHHNLMMLGGWLINPLSFSCNILFKSQSNGSPLDRQIELFEKEIYFINEAGNNSVNAIDGDLVLTPDSLNEFEVMNKVFKRKIKEIRSLKSYQKEKLGKLILDVGIMDRIRIPPDVDIKDTNVLTWINKTRRSPMDYVPQIRSHVPGCSVLITALKKLQQEIKQIDIDKSFVDRFQDSLTNKRSKYETCSLQQLQLYLTTLKDYPNDIDAKEVIASYKTMSNGNITLDSSIFELVDTSVLKKLKALS